MQRVDITHDFSLPVERVYAYLAEHEQLADVFGAQVWRVRDGDTDRNGAGSVRAVRLWPLPSFDETVTEATPSTLIAYSITRGSPLRGHRGTLEFTSTAEGCRLHYVIEFGAVAPGLAKVVRVALDRRIRRGLRRVEQRA